MPSKNALKTYQEDTLYHLYNRGVNKLPIFETEHDYKTMLSFLKKYLTPQDVTFPSRTTNNFHDEITLHAYCLMPNHYHLLVSQKNPENINFFMRSINSQYVRYFNSHHNRIGPLFQGRYKAAMVTSDEQLLYLTKYIHLNPLSLSTSGTVPEVKQYPYSSLKNYLGLINQTWVDTYNVLSCFSQVNPKRAYEDFVFSDNSLESISSLLIDE